MRAIVTGGAGFIGSHLVDGLVAAGDTVAVADNLSTGNAMRLPQGVKVWRLDISKWGFAGVCERYQPDVIYHLAAQISVTNSVARPAYDANVNIVGTVNVLEAARVCGAHVVFSSSGGAVYGRADTARAVGDPCAPESPYGLSKLAAEGFVNFAARADSLPHSVLRFANVYGPRQDTHGEGGVVAIFAAADRPVIYGDGNQTRDFVYVKDVVNSLTRAGTSGKPGTWNVGTGVETSVNELAGLFGITPEHKPERPGEVRRSVLDVEASLDLGWRPEVSLAEGVRRVQAWVNGNEPVQGEA